MASSIDLSSRRDILSLVDVVSLFRQALPGYRPLLVGAMARDVLLAFAYGIPIERATYDLDFAFAVDDWTEFLRIRDSLVATGECSRDPALAHRLLFRGNTRVDILPFGGVEETGRVLVWPPERATAMNVIGYREALADAVLVLLPGGDSLDVVSLPGLAALKLFAWRDRRRSAPPYGKDAVDLWSIMLNFREAGNDERIYIDAAHLLEQPDYDHRRAGAWLLGRDMRTLLTNGTGDALAPMLELLAKEVDADGSLDLARDMRSTDAQTALDLLRALNAGVKGEATPGT